MRLAVVAAIAVVALFVATRVALLVTSYDVNLNWEEPVFLFSGMELGRDGLAHILDHQDDLNHGGSVALLLLVVPWIQIVGTSLLTLKGLAILWSTVTLIAFLVVGWRYFSPRAALLWGLCFVVASPTLARLNVTLVGSHPEALLPCALALSAYLAWERCHRRATTEPAGVAFRLGLWSGLAVWISYVAVMFVAPLVVMRAIAGADRRRLALVTGGFLTGTAPWFLQNLWLRPHGAGLWRQHVTDDAPRSFLASAQHVGVELAASFGWAPPAGELLLATCVAALVLLTITVLSRRTVQGQSDALALLPLVAAFYLGFVMLLGARIPAVANEGYYHYRFYVGLQVALFWVLALAVDRFASRLGNGVVTAVAVVLALGALGGQAKLLGQGNHYKPDLENDRVRGCAVFGIAEADRSPDWPSAIGHLEAIRDRPCQDRAFAGLGWGIGRQFIVTRDVEATTATLQSIADEGLRWATCGGFNFLVRGAPSSAIRPEEYAVAWTRIQTVCHRPRS